MIKLNNKNITYVALADSNNSVKGVKEVWYADSANSVKLVYRRKDALIEGVDYEKYHWLVTEIPNGTFMDLPLNTSNFSFKRIFYDMLNVNYFIGKDALYTYHHAAYHNRIWDVKNKNAYWIGSALTSINNEITISSTSEILEINGEEVPQVDYPPSIIRFRNANSPAATSIFKTSSITVDGIKHYVPVKLLKPVPKWLDANGIRRQVGECGMIDLVSGKFYGNVNSVGTFTVENYYERKEWLSVQTTEKVTMMALPLSTSDFKYSIRLLDRVPNLSYFTTGWHTYGVSNTQTLVFIYDRKNSTTVYNCQTGFQLGDIIMIDSTAEDLLFNNISIPKYGFPAENFIIQTNNNVALNMMVSSITVDNKERYIPCTLTMDLPASMDANNIARTKGTSGMWDLVSDRFYGNVANSGTFKAVNLAEGVDYEVHNKLIVEDGRCTLPLNSEVFECIIENLSNNNNVVILQASSRYTYHYKSNEDNTSSALTCWDLTQNTDVVGIYHLNNPSTFISDGTAFKCNSSNVTKYGFPPDSIAIRSSRSFKISFSAISIDGIERYIPVKLLCSIPSKYDANGIARQAGECGMYDTVNDVFYGNVASSGSFTVEDDN